MQRNLSKSAYNEALKYIPGGVNSPVRSLKAVGNSPIFIQKAKGAKLTDIDKNKYIDFCLSWGVFILGHANNSVEKEIIKAVKNGTSYGLPTLQETRLAELICNAVSSIDKVRFVNSGTEAVMSAIRLARAYTHRDIIIKFDGCYHGHADHLLVSAGSGVAQLKSASSDGVPDCFVEKTISLPYNDINAVESLFSEIGNEIAAIIIEPIAANMGVIKADFEFLQTLRNLTLQYKSLLIFDEVITGFRIGLGGAQNYYGIQPDITTLGKIIGGGFPVGAYGGKAQIMSLIAPEGPVYQAGTLSGNPVAMSAGIKTLELLSQPGFYDKLDTITNYFINELKNIISNKKLTLHQVGPMFTLFFTDQKIRNFDEVKKCDTQKFALFFNKLLENGIYFSPSQFETNFISIAHTKSQLNKTISVIHKTLNEIL